METTGILNIIFVTCIGKDTLLSKMWTIWYLSQPLTKDTLGFCSISKEKSEKKKKMTVFILLGLKVTSDGQRQRESKVKMFAYI